MWDEKMWLTKLIPKQCAWNQRSQPSHAIMSIVSGLLQMQKSSRGAAGSTTTKSMRGAPSATPPITTSPLAFVDSVTYWVGASTVTYWCGAVISALCACKSLPWPFLSPLELEGALAFEQAVKGPTLGLGSVTDAYSWIVMGAAGPPAPEVGCYCCRGAAAGC